MLAPPLRGLEGLRMRMALQSMGLKDVKLDLDCSSTEDRAKGELVARPLRARRSRTWATSPSPRGSSTPMPTFWRVIDEATSFALEESQRRRWAKCG